MGGLSRALPGLAVAAMLSGCAVREASDPFRGFAGGDRDDAAKMSIHYVRFEARCDRCTLSWVARDETGTDRDSGTYSRQVTLHLMPGETTHAQFTATPSARDGTVRYVRIYVDGELAGEAVNEGATDPTPLRSAFGPLSTSAVVPLPGDPGDGTAGG